MSIKQEKQIFYRSSSEALNKAVEENDLASIQFLMTANSERISHPVDDGAKRNAFILSAMYGHLDIIKYFLKREHKKSINFKASAHHALREAIANGQVETVDYLLNTLETKRHININSNPAFYLKLAPANVLEYLIFDYKINIEPCINSLRNDPSVIQEKQDLIKILNYYQLLKEIDSEQKNSIKEKKIKI